MRLVAVGGEVYKVGLQAAADYLWNAAAYESGRSLRWALAAAAGPESVHNFLAFRDLFYKMYDACQRWLGAPQAFLKRAQELESQPFDEQDIAEMRTTLDDMEKLIAQLQDTCKNEKLVEEAQSRYERFPAYREAVAIIENLPPQPPCSPPRRRNSSEVVITEMLGQIDRLSDGS